MGGYKASKLQGTKSYHPGLHKKSKEFKEFKEFKEPNIMLPTAEFLFFYNLNIFAKSVSIQRDEYAGVFNVIVHDKLAARYTSQRHAIEVAIIKFNKCPEGV